MTADSLHVYLESLPAPVSEGCRDAFATLLRHQQVTDAYLVRIAAAHSAILLTFDRRLERVSSGAAKVVVLG